MQSFVGTRALANADGNTAGGYSFLENVIASSEYSASAGVQRRNTSIALCGF